MREINRVGAQGDALFIRVADLPNGATPRALGKKIVVAHSETGHHHSIAADGRVEAFDVSDPFVCYLRVTADFGDVVHERPFDTHETVRLAPGIWQVRRQREHTPEGFRRVED